MNIVAAVLGAMGTESPYAESKPLVVEKLQPRSTRARARFSSASKPRACATPTSR